MVPTGQNAEQEGPRRTRRTRTGQEVAAALQPGPAALEAAGLDARARRRQGTPLPARRRLPPDDPGPYPRPCWQVSELLAGIT